MDLAKSMEDFKREILADKTALRMELGDVEQMGTEQDCSEPVSLVSTRFNNWSQHWRTPISRFSNSNINFKKSAVTWKTPPMLWRWEIFMAMEDPSHPESPESIANGIQQPLSKETKVNKLLIVTSNLPRNHLERTIGSTNAEIEALVDENKQLIEKDRQLQTKTEEFIGAYDSSVIEEPFHQDGTPTPEPSSRIGKSAGRGKKAKENMADCLDKTFESLA
ncbi:hypothetical protein CAEBREN_02943 [Caenorhabditis brenneri]|uniref:Uncharacterized protein n=1 Tax=Caenorhabditis brenneri TaxID=135651 RepID=G0MHH8_CAEBE|nr:hypothetical protein CAEBREN_02943 [Caenorhabditis brenneri]